jgi:hypothetical protein
MGTTGANRLTDYGTDTSIKEDSCGKNFQCFLEDAENCEFFLQNQTIPNINDDITIGFNPSSNRLCATMVSGGLVIGYLPTEYNYIQRCVLTHTYPGKIVAASQNGATGLLRIQITVQPQVI